MLTQMLSAGVAGLLVLFICVLLMGWGGLLTKLQRIGLAMFASGLVLAAIPRFSGQPPGLGDLLMLSGLVLFFGATYGPKILERVDGLDGVIDNSVRVGPVSISPEVIRQAMAIERRRRINL